MPFFFVRLPRSFRGASFMQLEAKLCFCFLLLEHQYRVFGQLSSIETTDLFQYTHDYEARSTLTDQHASTSPTSR